MLGSGMPSSMLDGTTKLLSLLGASSSSAPSALGAGGSAGQAFARDEAANNQFIRLLNSFVSGAGNSQNSSKNPVSKPRHGSETGEANKAYAYPAELTSSPEARELVGRLVILAEEGVVSPEDLKELSPEEFTKLVNWIMAGAGGIFPAVEAPDILEKLNEWLSLFQSAVSNGDLNLQAEEYELSAPEGSSHPPEAISQSGESSQPPELVNVTNAYDAQLAQEVSDLLQQIMNVYQAEAEGSANQNLSDSEVDTQSLLSSIAGLDDLTADEKKALADAFLQEIARIASNSQKSERTGVAEKSLTAESGGAGKNGLETPDLSLEEILQQMSPAVLKQALTNAAQDVGAPELLLNRVELEKLPTSILKALAVEVIQVKENADPNLLAELDLIARQSLLQRMAIAQLTTSGTNNSGTNLEGVNLNGATVLTGEEAGIQLEQGEAPTGTVLTTASAIKPADLNGKAVVEDSPNPTASEQDAGLKAENKSFDANDNKQEFTNSRGESAKERFSKANQSIEPLPTSESEMVEGGIKDSSSPLSLGTNIITLHPEAEAIHPAQQSEANGIHSANALSQNSVEADPTRYIDAERNMAQINQILQISVRRGIQTATLQLSPPELGELKLQIAVKQGVVSAKILVDTIQARDLLHSGLNQLRSQMESEGIRISELSVEYDADENSQTQRGDHSAQGFMQRRGSSQRLLDEELLEEGDKTEIGGIFLEGGRVNTVA